MPIPRFTEPKTGMRYEIYLSCTKCGYAVVKDGHTEAWTDCRLCHAPMTTRRVDYGRSTEPRR